MFGENDACLAFGLEHFDLFTLGIEQALSGGGIDVVFAHEVLAENEDAIGTDFGETRTDHATHHRAASAIGEDARSQRGEQWKVSGQHTEFALHARRLYFVD